jgi:nitroreductase
MDFFELVKARRSVRAFTDKPIEAEKFQQILEAANCAPSAGNLQSYEIYVVRGLEQRQALVRAALNQEFIAQAPVALVFCAHPQRAADRYGARGVNLYSLQDATIACSFAVLAATALGLASVWVGAYDDEDVRQAIGAPEEHIPVAVLPLGYGAEAPPARPRRGLPDLVHEV